MGSKKRTIAIIMIIVVSSVILTICGMTIYLNYSDKYMVVNSKNYQEIYNFANENSKLYNIEKLIKNEYLWDVKKEKMMDSIYKAAVASLGDEYSAYLTADENKTLIDSLDGKFSGVGVSFIKNGNEDFEVVEILEGSPASETNIKIGDFITKVNGKSFDNTVELAEAIRGEIGTTVDIEYVHNNKKRNVKVTRGVVEEASVKATVIKNNIGYIRIVSFDENTAEQFETEWSALELKKLKGIIIDLRNNSGGYVDQGIKIADKLLPECNITYTEDKAGKKEYYNSDVNCTDKKYVVLVNENTASTSEILASAIKDNHGGKIVGTLTFGKGIIQQTTPFKDGSALKLTVREFYSPLGNTIHKKGVSPDFNVKLRSNSRHDFQLEKAITLLND